MARRRRSIKRYVLVILLLFAAAIAGWLFWPGNSSNITNITDGKSPSTNQLDNNQSTLPVINLQPTIDAWNYQHDGTASVIVYDLANNKIVASLNPDRQYFTASIYKLYVAYIGYQKIADGSFDADEPYLEGYTRLECLDAMIRDSYSPCGEKWWNELGREKLTAKLQSYGLSNTSMTGLFTSAQDAATILERLFEQQDLTKDHVKLFLDSLKEQPDKYRGGLPSGFSKSTVYNKVGWNEQIEWHDTAIITLPNGRSYIITVLTENVGSSQIKSLGQVIEDRLTR
jgi:beta-lactamase class A